MKIRVEDVLAVLAELGTPGAGGTVAAVAKLVALTVPLFGERDQARLQEALASAMAANDEGHARLQEKLSAAPG